MEKCQYKDCREAALSLSDCCYKHLVDKKTYAERLSEHIKRTGSIRGFYLRHLEFPNAEWQNLDAEDTDLAGCDLSHSDLAAANLKNANLTGANLKNANLIGVDLEGAHLLRCDLSGARLWQTSLVNTHLAEANLEEADFLKATLSNVRLWHVKLDKAKLLTRHNFIGKTPIDEKGALSASEAYRSLKQYFIANGRYDDASWASFKEKSLERRYLLQNKKFLYLPSLLMAALCGYGEKPYRVVLSSLVIVLGYALLYEALGILKVPVEQISTGLDIWDYIYFSIVTFTTVGYGDLTTKMVTLFQMLAGSEAFIGAFMMGLFVFTLARKYTAR